MSPRPIAIAIVAVAVLFAMMATLRHSRRKVLRRIRAEWGEPRKRDRKMDAIHASHRSRLHANGASGSSLHDRTWNVLSLDEVFAELDRTESSLGQYALYHHLRTAPLADNLDAFDALTTRMSADAPGRERAQMALARLQDLNGYDLWWLSKTDALDIPSWYAAFPALTVIFVVLAALALLLGGSFVPAMLATLAVNIVVGLATANRTAPPAQPSDSSRR